MLEPAPGMIEPPVAQPQPPAVLPIERAAAALEVVLCSGFPTQLVIISILVTFGMHPKAADGGFNAPFVFTLTLVDTLMVVGLVCFFLRAHRESIRGTLFGNRPVAPELVFGVWLIPASFAVVIAVLALVQIAAPWLRNVEHNPLADLARTRGQAVIFAFVVMIAGGVREEVQRGFVLHRFDQFLGGARTGLVIFSVLFGLGHIEQGYNVVVATAVLGAFWGAVFLWRRSVAAPVVGHAGFNLLQVVQFITWGA